MDCLFTWWSCRESNPGPNKIAKRFLHAYFMIHCREQTGPEPTNLFLSCIVLSSSHSLLLQQPVFVVESAAAHGNRSTCTAALMTG